MATKWGIVSTGRICNDFVLCLRSLPSTEHQIVTVGARSLESAKNFACKHKIGNAVESYEAVARHPDVEVVYIGNLNVDHFKVSKMMLEAGKHVLCEKPLCMDVEETEQLIAVAKKTKKFLMEAVWSRFFPAYKKIRDELSKETIGAPNLVQVMFAFDLGHIYRLTKSKLGGSAVLDIGIYAVQLATLVFGSEKPKKITASGYLNKEGVDEVALITLEYPGERAASLTVSSRTVGCNHAIIAGPKGYLKVMPPFHCPTVIETRTQRHEFKLPEVEGQMNFENSQGLVYEAQVVRECLQKGLTEHPLMTLEESKTIAFIMTEIRNQLGVRNFAAI